MNRVWFQFQLCKNKKKPLGQYFSLHYNRYHDISYTCSNVHYRIIYAEMLFWSWAWFRDVIMPWQTGPKPETINLTQVNGLWSDCEAKNERLEQPLQNKSEIHSYSLIVWNMRRRNIRYWHITLPFSCIWSMCFFVSPPPGVCVWTLKVWMRRVKTICHFICS